MAFQWNKISIMNSFIICLYLLSTFNRNSDGAAVPVNRHSRYTKVATQEFNCTGLPDGYFIHPSSCSVYYACVAEVAYKAECVPGLLFHQSTTYCESEHLVNCTRVPITTTTLKTTMTTTMTTPMTTTMTSTTTKRMTSTEMTSTEMTTTGRTTRAPSGHVDCSGQLIGTLLRNPVDCTKYFECTGTATVPFQCPGNTVFRQDIQGCDYRQNVPECP